MNQNIFKAYDIRATYPSDINESVAYTIGKSYGSYLQKYFQERKCVVGHDNRLSSPSLNEALIKGLLETGLNVIDYGLITTPMHYYTRYIENCFGIMITASHNPKDDNGFKFSFDKYANARGNMIEDFKEFTFKGNFLKGNGTLVKRDIKKEYLKYMKDNINMGSKPINVVIDPGNGTTSVIIKEIMALFPTINATYICDKSDATFPNHHPDPAVEENMTMLKEQVVLKGADLGIAYDGDGDRLGIIDELGNFIMADKYMIVAMRDIIKNAQNKTFVVDVKCSKSLTDEIEKLGGTVYMSRTGTSFTECVTKKQKSPLGGELSGHIFFNDRGPEVCSAIYAGLRLIEILSKTDKTFSELLQGINKYYSTPEIKIPCPNEKKFTVINEAKKIFTDNNIPYSDIDGIRFELESSWGLIRASNTGPNLTLRFESSNESELNTIEKEFTELINSLLT